MLYEILGPFLFLPPSNIYFLNELLLRKTLSHWPNVVVLMSMRRARVLLLTCTHFSHCLDPTEKIFAYWRIKLWTVNVFRESQDDRKYFITFIQMSTHSFLWNRNVIFVHWMLCAGKSLVCCSVLNIQPRAAQIIPKFSLEQSWSISHSVFCCTPCIIYLLPGSQLPLTFFYVTHSCLIYPPPLR